MKFSHGSELVILNTNYILFLSQLFSLFALICVHLSGSQCFSSTFVLLWLIPRKEKNLILLCQTFFRRRDDLAFFFFDVHIHIGKSTNESSFFVPATLERPSESFALAYFRFSTSSSYSSLSSPPEVSKATLPIREQNSQFLVLLYTISSSLSSSRRKDANALSIHFSLYKWHPDET